MKLLRHILSHLFLISFLIAVVSVFYYRSFLFPVDMVEKIDEAVNDVYPPALSFTSKRDYFWSIKGERIVSFDDLTIFKKNDKNQSSEIVTKEPKVAIENKKSVVAIKDVETETPLTSTNEIFKNETSVDVVSLKEKNTKLDVSAGQQKEKKNSVKEENLIEVQDSDTSSERELLINARTAFNQGAMEQSEKKYIELIQLDNDNPDIFGELGNVYYTQGKWNKAGQAYYEAAVRLISEGNRDQVVYLHRVIEGLDTEHAEKLSQLMMR